VVTTGKGAPTTWGPNTRSQSDQLRWRYQAPRLTQLGAHLTEEKPAIFPLYTSTPIDRKPHSDSRQITFLHPGYTKPGNILIQLEAFDEGEGGQTGIYAHTAWLTCVIMAANAEYHTLGRPQHQCCCCHGDWLVCNGMNNNG